jgi:hypothetical protein
LKDERDFLFYSQHETNIFKPEAYDSETDGKKDILANGLHFISQFI